MGGNTRRKITIESLLWDSKHRKRYSTAAKKRQNLWKTFWLLRGGRGLSPSPQCQKLRPRKRRMLTTTARPCAPFPLAFAPVGSVGRRLRLFAVLKLSAPRPVLRPARPAKAGFSSHWRVRNRSGRPLDTLRNICNFFPRKWRYSVILAAWRGNKSAAAATRPTQPKAAAGGAYLRRRRATFRTGLTSPRFSFAARYSAARRRLLFCFLPNICSILYEKVTEM